MSLYMDDLKLLGRSEEDLKNEIQHMKAISKDININFGLENGAKICYKKKVQPEEDVRWKYI